MFEILNIDTMCQHKMSLTNHIRFFLLSPKIFINLK